MPRRIGGQGASGWIGARRSLDENYDWPGAGPRGSLIWHSPGLAYHREVLHTPLLVSGGIQMTFPRANGLDVSCVKRASSKGAQRPLSAMPGR